MKKLRKINRLVTLLGLLVCLCWVIFWGMDCSPPQNDDLQVARLDIVDEENAFYYFNQAIEKIYWPEDKEKLIVDMVTGKEWNSNLAKELIEKNEGVFECLDQGLAHSHFQVLEITDFDTVLPYLVHWRKIARLKSVHSGFLFRHGEEKKAFDEAMKIIEFGHMIETCPGCLMNYLVGIANKEIGLIRLRKMVVDTELGPEILATYVNQLNGYKISEKGLADAIRTEYMFASKITDDLIVGRFDWEIFGGDQPSIVKSNEVMKKVKAGYNFQPNRTKRLFAEMYRAIIGNIPMDYNEMKHFRFLVPERFATVTWMVSGNGVGKILCRMMIPALGRVLYQKCKIDTSVIGTQLLLAMKCYESRNGELPKSLEELVPAYVNEVPDDPFDGKLMRYSVEHKKIYSVGKDLEDSTREDITFKIKF